MTHSIKTRARAILGILLQYPIRQLLMTVLALLLASALGVALFCARALVTQRLDYIFLVWNLILAWSPLFFSGSAALVYLWRGHKSFAFIGCAILWLLFLPNAPYIVTDFVHLRPRPPDSGQPDRSNIHHYGGDHHWSNAQKQWSYALR